MEPFAPNCNFMPDIKEKEHMISDESVLHMYKTTRTSAFKTIGARHNSNTEQKTHQKGSGS